MMIYTSIYMQPSHQKKKKKKICVKVLVCSRLLFNEVFTFFFNTAEIPLYLFFTSIGISDSCSYFVVFFFFSADLLVPFHANFVQ